MPEMVSEDERRCPYCDAHESDMMQPLGKHVMQCQSFRLRD